jgi:predicted nucleotidyltransferase
MKRSTALKYCLEITKRVHQVNGLIPTPNCQYEGMKVLQIWIFGSTAKGSKTPNDLDLLIDWELHGKCFKYPEVRKWNSLSKHIGIAVAYPSQYDANKWITKGMLKISVHDLYMEKELANVPEKRMIYPIYEMDLV